MSEIKLEFGMLLRAKHSLKTCDRSFSNPTTVFLEKDTVVIIANSGTSRGDVGCKAIGKFDEYGGFKPIPNLSDGFFREGHRSSHPYDKGCVDTDYWELVGHLKGDEFLFFQRQGPHNTQVPLVVVKDHNDFKFVVGSWDGWSLVPPRTYLENKIETQSALVRYALSFLKANLDETECQFVRDSSDILEQFSDSEIEKLLEHPDFNLKQFRIVPTSDSLYSLQYLDERTWITMFTSSKVDCEREKDSYERTWGKYQIC